MPRSSSKANFDKTPAKRAGVDESVDGGGHSPSPGTSACGKVASKHQARVVVARMKVAGWWSLGEKGGDQVLGDGPLDARIDFVEKIDEMYRKTWDRPVSAEELGAILSTPAWVESPNSNQWPMNQWVDTAAKYMDVRQSVVLMLPEDSLRDARRLWRTHRNSGIQIGVPIPDGGFERTDESLQNFLDHIKASFMFAQREAVEMVDAVDPDRLKLARHKLAMQYEADQIPGGVGDKAKSKDVDPKQLAKGIKVEMEHTSDKALAREIALDHLSEPGNADYYDRLETIEKHSMNKQAEMTHAASIALMKWLSVLAKRLGIAKHVYVVGGAVRNFLIDQPIKDIDMVVDSLALGGRKDSAWVAEQIARQIPAKSDIVTDALGVAKVLIRGSWVLDGHELEGNDIEIVNARAETYEPGTGHKPTEVKPTSIEEDTYRREFTFNTLMWRLLDLAEGPEKAEVIDITGCGLRDLENREMRCPSDPDKTFGDDPTRIIRTIKFAFKYGFKLPPDVKAAAKRQAKGLKRIPAKTWSTLEKIVLGNPQYKKALVVMEDLGVIEVIKEMMQENKQFRRTLAGYASKRGVAFMFDLMDLGVPVGSTMSFMDSEQQHRFRDISAAMDRDEAQAFLAAVKNPGNAYDKKFMPALAQQHGFSGKSMAQFGPLVTEVGRELLLDEPALMGNATKLKRLIADRVGDRVGRLRRASDHVAVPFDTEVYDSVRRFVRKMPVTRSMQMTDSKARGSIFFSLAPEQLKDAEKLEQAVKREFGDAVETSHKPDFNDALRVEIHVKPSRRARLVQAWGPVMRLASKIAAVPEKYKHIDFKPPEGVAKSAEKGLEYRQKASPSNRGGLTTEEASKEGIGSGVQRASNLKNRSNLTPETIKMMRGFFSRHEKNKGVKTENKGEPWNDKGHVSWLLWGGDPGKAWVDKIIKQMEAADEKEKQSKQAADVEMSKSQMEKLHAEGEVEIDGVSISYKEAAEDYGLGDGKNKPTDEALWAKVLGEAKSKFDVYPSAAASAWAAQQYNEQGGGWNKQADSDGSYMSVQHLRELRDHSDELLDKVDEETSLPDWAESLLTESATKLRSVYEFMQHGRGRELEAQWGRTLHEAAEVRALRNKCAGVTGTGESVGLFIPLPKELADQFPSLGANDDSPTHVTLFYGGGVPADRLDEYLSTIQGVLSGFGPIKARLGDVDYFTHVEKQRRVAYVRVWFSRDMGSLRDRLRSAIEDAGFESKDSFPLAYNPHATLAYMDGLDSVYEGPVPSGDWVFDSIPLWGLPQKHNISLRGGSAIRVANAHLGLLPVMDPVFNIRECVKQLILLEDHLFHPRKRCPDCIKKHTLFAEALMEEAVTLDTKGEHPYLPKLADDIRSMGRAILTMPLGEAAQVARQIRKLMTNQLLGLRALDIERV